MEQISETDSQYKHLKEIALFTYEQHCKREDSIIQQAVQMQTVFSFVITIVFVVLTILLQYVNELPKKFYFVSFTLITLFLLLSLFFATLAQWRYKKTTICTVEEIKPVILNDDPQNFNSEKYKCEQFVELLNDIDTSLDQLNDKRTTWLVWSIISFFITLAIIVISFFVAIFILL